MFTRNIYKEILLESFKQGTSQPVHKSWLRLAPVENGSINFSGELTKENQPFREGQFETSGSDIYYDGGNVGIGTSTPSHKLEVKSEAENGMLVESDHDNAYGYNIKSKVNNSLTKAFAVSNSGNETFMVYGSGKTYIDNILYAKEIEVRTPVWGDFVFDDSYKLRDLKELEKFISENNHLPDVPSANEVIDKGFNLGQMDKTLLVKIEELTLYIIQLNKKVEDLTEQNEILTTKVNNLK